MMSKNPFIIIAGLLLLFSVTGVAQRPMEKLSRSVVAQKVSQGVYVNWRIPADEYHHTSYRLYRNGTMIHETGIKGASNFLDAAGTTSSVYTVTAVKNGVESAPSAPGLMITNGYFDIPLRDLKSLGKTGYFPNDATVADLDGDGNYEVIVKRLNVDWSVSNTNYTYFEAYKLDGTFLWAIDVGPNITSDVEINIAAFDLDGDGKAEVFLRTSEGTVFGDGKMIGDTNGDGIINYRYSISSNFGYMNAGPEFLSLVDGETGAELDRVNFIPRGNSSDWGDGYGHRANKFFFGAPFLDGQKPSIFIGRGIYTQTKMQTYDVVNKKLVPRWFWESGNGGPYFGQGNHNFTIADVDGDGRDEITWGSMCIDDDGKGLYSTGMGHGDAMHVSDFDPYRKGLEVFSCLENSPVHGTLFRDAATGQILHHHITPGDCGRCCAGNITDLFKGAELWGGGFGYSATNLVQQQHFGTSENFTIYWDGSLTKELLDHSGFSTSTGVGWGQIRKFVNYGDVRTLLNANAYSCNYTKGTPNLQADILGDWREEVIWWRPDSMALRVYVTPHHTEHRIYSLMHDHHYRQAIAWQMCGYNQPPHTSFYLGSDFPEPISPKTTNGKLIWKGNTEVWNRQTANWMDGNDAAGLFAGNSPLINFSNGQRVLFETRGGQRTVNITENLEPEMLTVSGQASYTIGGNGSLQGEMRLDKMGDGYLKLNGTHTYSGLTDIWQGDFWLDGTITNSPVKIRRHANAGGKGTFGNGITTEFNAAIIPGGPGTIDTLRVIGNVTLVEGARLKMDLSDNPSIPEAGHMNTSGKQNDAIIIYGTLDLQAKSIIDVEIIAGKLSVGDYLIARAEHVTGNLSQVKVEGAAGVAVELQYRPVDKGLYLVVKGVRGASSVVWTGKNGNNWDLAVTENWSLDGADDVFVGNDSVMFSTTAATRVVNITGTMTPSYMEVNSTLPYTFDGAGKLSGNMKLVKKNSGTLTINNRNDFSGTVRVEGGSLIMKYAPTATNVGGIGSEDTNPNNFVVADSALIQFNTANEISGRAIRFEGSGGVFNVPSTLIWNGVLTGSRLIKTGNGILNIGNNNSNLLETVLHAGTLRINAAASVPYGAGRKITLLGGTFEKLNDIGAYLTNSTNYEVPTGATATVIAAPRCEYNGTLTGGGTLNWVTDFIRAYINGNWSAYTGRINISKNNANSSYQDKFIVNNAAGFPNATINLASSDVIMCYKNGTSDNGTTTLKIGMLTGVAGSVYHNAGLEVGGTNSGGSFAGTITGVTAIRKVGTGLWVLSGENTNTGSTTITGGTLNVTGKLGTGAVFVQPDAFFNLSGSAGGSVIVSPGGIMNVNGSIAGGLNNSGTVRGSGTVNGASNMLSGSILQPGGGSIATLTFNNNLTLRSGSRLSMQVNGGGNVSDRVKVGGVIVCEGMLEVAAFIGTFKEGSVYKLIDAPTISGTFEAISLPDLPDGLAWDMESLYTEGVIKVIQDVSSVINPALSLGLLQNPTRGEFNVRTGMSHETFSYTVTDISGRMIMNDVGYSDAAGVLMIDITPQPDGIYMIRISKANAETGILKVIKKD